MSVKFTLGVDVGTTGIKAVVCSSAPEVVFSAWRPVHLYSDWPGWAEEEPAEWWNGVRECIRECLTCGVVEPSDIAAVGVSGMVPALVVLDDRLNVARRSIQQNDVRAHEEIHELKHRLDETEIVKRTGNTINQQTLAPKLVWLAKHEPETIARARCILGSYDYVNLRLTGAVRVERNWALESGLYDVVDGMWYTPLLDAIGLNSELLPPVAEPTSVVGTVSAKSALETGLREGTPVVAGSADHVASALAAGVRESGDTLLKIGGAGDILYCLDRWVADPRLFIDYHDIPGKFLLNGCMASSGSVVKWYVSELGGTQIAEQEPLSESYRRLDIEASKIRAGSMGLIVVPYFLGEKTPVFDPLARGVVFGLSLSHKRAHIYRAIMEGVAYAFRHHIEVISGLGFPISRVLMCDGGARSRVWRQITANVIGREVNYVGKHSGSSAGAAFVAGMGVGLFRDWAQVEPLAEVTSVEMPGPREIESYDRLYPIYRGIYEDLKSRFRQLSAAETHSSGSESSCKEEL